MPFGSAAPVVRRVMLMSLFLLGCADLKQGDVFTSPSDPPESGFSQDERKAARMEAWIERMDPFVNQSAEGAYVLDWDGFLRSIRETHPEVADHFVIGSAASDDTRVIQELKASMAAGNDLLQQTPGGLDTLGWACWTYWWGRRCCYWGNTGWGLVAIMAAGTAYPPWGYALTPYSAWAGYLMQVYGGFCANGSWAGGPPWLTRP
ncbi:MAG: hypothetical protein HY340_02450 [Candidatus Kerfeldbacteria bacterium]|nr:hypothetical protein [Candidatus Kerfeldbacteria bacterium]